MTGAQVQYPVCLYDGYNLVTIIGAVLLRNQVHRSSYSE